MTGKEFLHERKSLGWTQGNVAKVMGCTVRSVRRWEKGEVRVPQSLETIIALRHDLERQMSIANEHVDEAERLREALEAAPLIGRTESVYDFMERQSAWLNGPYRAALEQSK